VLSESVLTKFYCTYKLLSKMVFHSNSANYPHSASCNNFSYLYQASNTDI